MKVSAPPPIARVRGPSIVAAGRDRESVQEQRSAAHNPAPAATSFATLVTLSQIEDDRERRRKLAQDCDEGIDLLESLNKELARGSVPPEKLLAMQAWLNRAARPAHPTLGALYDQIALRVSVELAKLGKL